MARKSALINPANERYQIVAEYANGEYEVHGGESGYQNLYVADGAAKMLLDQNPHVARVWFQRIAKQ